MAKPCKFKNRKFFQLLEFLPLYLAFRFAQLVSLSGGHAVSWLVGDLLYYLVPRRRKIALDNLRAVFGQQKSEPDIRRLARRSFYSFIAALFETAKFLSFSRSPVGDKEIQAARAGLEPLFQKAKNIHDQSGGCIFVTPHIGNWELLPYAGSSVGIPLVIVVRPLDNVYLERLLGAYREASGQLIVAKKNSMHFLQTALRQRKSIAMLPDQSTMKAISVDYLGREASTTPVPALLALHYHRPIVVVACCRASTKFRYHAFVSDPIWPTAGAAEKPEVFRLTRAMNREMEKIIYQYPEQYFWMHDRWKKYRTRGELFLN